MNTLILSSSLAGNSRSYLLCKAVEQELIVKGDNITFVDARTIPLKPVHKGLTSEMEHLAKQVETADNIIIGMGVHCYSVNDALKIILDACFGKATGKFFGILCAAGGERRPFHYAPYSNLHERMAHDAITKNSICYWKRFY